MLLIDLFNSGTVRQRERNEEGETKAREALRPANRQGQKKTNAINSKEPFCPFPRPLLFLFFPHLLRSVTAGFSQSLVWLGWDAPSLPHAVGGSGREEVIAFFFFLVASGSTSVDDDGGRAAATLRKEETTLLASGFDRRRQKGVARSDATRRSAGGASEVVLERKEELFWFFSNF